MAPGSWHELSQRFRLGQITGDPGYVARGASGEVWRLTTTTGRFAVKWQFPWAPTDARPADVQVQLAAAAAGIPLPRPVLAPDGVAVTDVGGRYVRVYEWVDLAEPEVPPVTAATAAEAGRLLGLLHGLALPAEEPVDPWYTEVPERGYWTSLAERARAAGAAWAPGLTAARGLIAELSRLVIRPKTRPIICHRDFNPDNVPYAADGRLVVLDWEECGSLSPDRELGYAVFTWCSGQGELDVSAASALLAAYAGASGRDTKPDRGFFATAVATHLNILRSMAEQALEDPEHRAFAEGMVAEVLEHHLTDLHAAVRLGFSLATRPRARESAGKE